MPRSFSSTIVSIIVSLTLLGCLCHGFVPISNSDSSKKTASSTRTTTYVIPPEIAAEVQDARGQFIFWLFGASGGAGIARSAFPRMYNSVRTIQSLKGSTPTLGGEKLGISPLCGYPEDLCVKDVEKVINNPMTVEKMVEKYPVEGSFLASKGYLAFSAFEQANKGANPLAIRAVFDTFAQSTDITDPRVAQEKLDSYKQGISKVKDALLKSKLTGYVAIFSLLFLLGLADVVAFSHVKDGFFYYWTLEDGISNLPKYFIGF
jgi:hypothetical protein